ncbi:MAG TPA: sugar kinase [Kiritimatiellae bacterium]|nr:sugar kinase [Kiritimatiellia bacterium]
MPPPPQRPNVLIVGSIALDTVETPREKRENLIGGSATYASFAAAIFSSVGIVGIVGEDFPAQGISLLQARGVDTRGLVIRPGRTFYWHGRYEENMDNRTSLRTELNVFADFDPRLPPGYITAPYVFLANIEPRLQLKVLDQVRAPSFVMADTMDLWIRTAADELDGVIQRVDLLTINESEVRLLTRETTLARAARRLLSRGLNHLLVKKGESGSLLFSRERLLFVPAFPLEEVRDPTGAGDAFAGAFIGSLAARGSRELEDLYTAALSGSSVASFAVESFGADSLAHLTKAIADSRKSQLLSMVHPSFVKQ